MKRMLAIGVPLLMAWCPHALPQTSQPIPTEIFKCTEGGKAVYQDGLCGSGPNKSLKMHDARGIEAPKGRAPEYSPPGPAPVAIIPYTPSKPLSYTPLQGGGGNSMSPCRSTNGMPC